MSSGGSRPGATGGLLRIGDFSRLTGLSLRVLRHYDEIGLLVPTATDRASGYRWYDPGQLAAAHRIVALKELGLSLAQVGEVLAGQPSDEELVGMLRLERSRSSEARDQAERRIRLIDRELDQLRRHGRLEELPVVVRAAPDQPVLSARRPFDDLDTATAAVQRVLAATEAIGGALVVVGHGEPVGEAGDGPLDLELALVCAEPGPVTVDHDLVLTPGLLPAVPTLATVVTSGDLDVEHGRALRSVGRWLAATGHRLDGPGREVVHRRVPPAPDTVEIQFPVAPSP